MNQFRKSYFLILLMLMVSCHRQIPATIPTHTSLYTVSADAGQDSELLAMLLPYRSAMEAEMNVVIGFSAETLVKEQPESTLGNFMADVLLVQGHRYFGRIPHVSIVNYGGIRIPQLPAGEITRGKIFELMPFDNFVVEMELKGDELQQVAHQMASSGGWPVAGMSYSINSGKAENIKVNGEVVDAKATYRIIVSDYLATGGDNMVLLATKPFNNSGILLRDALIDYVTELQQEGKQISATKDGRVQHVQ